MAMKAPAPPPTFEPCPRGPQAAVLCDIIDCGIITSSYRGQEPKRQHKIRLRWQSEKLMADGKPFLVQKQYTWSMHEKGTLRKDLESWRGRKFTEQEARDFDLEKILNKPCYLIVIHTRKDRGVFADVQTIVALPKGMKAPTVRDYVRVVERPRDTPAAAGAARRGDLDQREPGYDDDPGVEPPPDDIDDFGPGAPEPPPDDDIPF